MKNTLVLVSALLVIVAAVAIFGAAPQPDGPAIGSAAPDFSLPDVKGKEVKLSEFKGKFVVLEWTNPNCPFVQRHYSNGLMPELQKAYTEKGVVWLTINSTNKDHRDYETGEDLEKKYTKWGAAFTDMLLDPSGEVGRKYDARTTPHMFVIGKDGTLLYQGAIDDDPRGNKDARDVFVKDALESAMKGKEVATTSTKPYGCSVKY